MQNKSMAKALTLAKKAGEAGEVPVGAVITDTQSGAVIAVGENRMQRDKNACHHAECLVISQACQLLQRDRLDGYTLTVTLEPCAMCAGAIAHARLDRLVFGAYDPKGGGVEHGPQIFLQPTTHHRPEVIGGVEEAECARLLKEFFTDKR